MAIFTENEELQRQGRRVAMDKVSGGREKAMKLLGYKDTGEFNQWGKFLSALPVPGVSTARNLVARNISKGTDTGDVLKEGTAGAFAGDLNKLKFGMDVAKTVATAGAAGGAEAGASGAEAATGGGGGSLGSLFGGGKDGGGGIKNLFGGIKGKFENANEAIQEKIGKKDLTPGADDVQAEIDDMDTDLISWKQGKENEGFTFKNGKVYDPEGTELGDEKEVFATENMAVDNGVETTDANGSEKKGLGSKISSNLPIIGSGMKVATGIMGEFDTAEEEAKKFQGQSKLNNPSYL